MSSEPPIAIVGMACRFPGAPDLEAFWRLLLEGRDAVEEVPLERWDVNAYYDPDRSAPGKVVQRYGGFLRDVDRFDAAFFGISPREAPHVDPRQRLMLEVAWEALEDAGIPAEAVAGSATGVYVAVLTNDFDQLLSRDLTRFQAHTGLGTANSAVANRLSYFFDWHGPSLVLDTACSGSLVAIDLAVRDLRAGYTTLALAGGVSLNLLPTGDVFFTKSGALSAEGRCRAFDASASGMVRGEGAAVVLLKPLDRALADGNRVYAVIRATAVNHGGRSNGMLAPNPAAQEALLRAAYRRAGVAPTEVQYVEAHGTGTPLGDPIEVGALAAVLGAGRAPDHPCVIGSLKTNVGHPEAAAGVAGVIKVALALARGVLPPTVHFRELHPLIAQLDFPVRVLQRASPWPDPTRRRVAGVSAFGFAGTNAHVVLEEAPPAAGPALAADAGPAVLPLAARGPEALAALAGRYAAFLREADPSYSAREICRAAALGRSALDYRLAVAGRDRADLAAKLVAFADGRELREGAHAAGPVAPDAPRLAFVFGGQGNQWPGMGRELWASEHAFREALAACAAAYARYAGWSLTDVLFGVERRDWQAADVAQPLLWAYQVALAALWRAWGVTPGLVVGQSLGEVAAAHVAGALSLDDAARIVWHRSRLIKTLAGQGQTAVVGLPLAAAERALAEYGPRLSVAGTTGSQTSVVAGEPAALAAFLAALERQGVYCRLIENMDVAAHSAQMDPLLPELEAALRDLRPGPAAVPIVSTVTCAEVAGEQLDSAYWARNVRAPFHFAEVIAALIEAGQTVFLEVSARSVLTGPISQSLAAAGRDGVALASVVRDAPEREQLLAAAGALFTLGYPLAWARIYPEAGRPIALPHYPWQRERYWFDNLAAPAPEARRAGAHPLLGEHVESPAWPGRHLWELDLRAHTPAYLRDHRVGPRVLLPGAALLDMALAAARAAPAGAQARAGGAADDLVDARFERALWLADDAPTRVQVVLAPAPGGEYQVEVFSRPAAAEPSEDWTRHATCRLRPAAAAPPAAAPALPVLQARCVEPVDVAAFYASMAARGIQYGPAFRVVRALWRGEREALGRITLDAPAAGDAPRYRLHPTLLDGALQVAAAALPATDTATYLPSAVGRLHLAGPAPPALWCYARLAPDAAPGAPEIRADLWLFDDAGASVGLVEGFVARRLDAAEGEGPAARDCVYEIVWQAAPLPPEPGRATTGAWLLLADAGGWARRLADRLEARGEPCTLVTRAELALDAGTDPLTAFAGLVARLTGPDRPPLQGVVFLWALDAAPADPAPADLARAGGRLAWEAAQLVRALAEARLPQAAGGLLQPAGPPQDASAASHSARVRAGRVPKLWLVTRQAQALPHDAGGLALAGAPLWGLGRVIALEHPELWGGAVDLGSDDPDHDAALLAADLGQPTEDDEIAYRAGARWVPRLVPAQARGRQPVLFRPDGCYLIVGGLTGIGLETARWMARQGARRLLLIGRTALPPRDQWRDLPPDHPAATRVAAIRDLEALGATVYAYSADAGQPEQVAAVLAAYQRECLVPIRGVVYSAVVLRDELLVRADERAFRWVFGTKAEGAWALHRLTQHQPLDFFVVYSSMSSLVGQFGQGGYAAGNAFLDALVHHRRALGLPALAINWGLWGEVGFVAREFGAGQVLPGIRRIAPDDGIRALASLLGSDLAQAAVVRADWSEVTRTPLLAGLTGAQPGAEATAAAPEAEVEVLALLMAAPAEREARLTEALRDEAARVLRLDAARLSVSRPLTHFGMDSIMAVEFRNRIQARYHVQLSLVELFTVSVAQLAARVAELLQADDDLQRLLAEVERLSAEEARALLEGARPEGAA
jgi:myxalamid-type polyketide synthase MxaE and MxaD